MIDNICKRTVPLGAVLRLFQILSFKSNHSTGGGGNQDNAVVHGEDRRIFNLHIGELKHLAARHEILQDLINFTLCSADVVRVLRLRLFTPFSIYVYAGKYSGSFNADVIYTPKSKRTNASKMQPAAV